MDMPTNDIFITQDGNRVKLEGAELEAFLAQKAIDQKDAQAAVDLEQKTRLDLEAKKASAQAKLAALGLDSNDLEALGL